MNARQKQQARDRQAARLIRLLASLLENYSEPGCLPPSSRTPTVVETLAEADAWLAGGGMER